MNMKHPIYKPLLFLLPAFLISLNLLGQKGQLFMTNFKPESDHYDAQVFDIEQGEYGQMFVASRSGILAFNGEIWTSISTPGTPYVLTYDTLSQKMWVGCKNSLGFLSREINGKYAYQEVFGLSDGLAEFRQMNVQDSTASFYSDPLVIQINTHEQLVRDTLLIDHGYGRGMITSPNGNFVVKQDGFYRLADGQFAKTDLLGAPTSKRLLFSVETRGQILTGWEDGSLFYFDGKGFSEWLHEGKNYIQENFLTDGIALPDGRIVLLTITGGAVIIDEAGKTQHYLNYNTGLPDDEILASGLDGQGGLWLAHDYGLTRVDLYLPLKNYAFYPGLSGNVLAVAQYNKTMYVGTSEGLFSLEEVKDYEKLEVILRKKESQEASNGGDSPAKTSSKKRFSIFSNKEKDEPAPSTLAGATSNEPTLTVKTTEAPKKESKGVLGGLFKKNKKGKEEDTPTLALKPIEEVKPEPIKEEVKKPDRKPRSTVQTSVPVTKKVYKLRSIKYQYVKVSGIDAKTQMLKVFAGSLWASTSLGLYEIKDGKANKVISVREINAFYYDETHNVIMLATESGIKILAKENGKWLEKPDYSGINFPVYSMARDQSGNYWFSSDSQVGTFGLMKGNMENIRLSEIENPFSDIIYTGLVKDTIRFFLSDLVYRFNAENGTLEPDLAMNQLWNSRPKLYEDKGQFWLNRAKDWTQLEGNSEINLAYLRLFKEVGSLYTDADKNLWVIAGNQQLFKIPTQSANEREVFPVFVSSVSNLGGQPLTLQNLTLEHNENGLSFYFASPFYLAEKSVEYQYFIEGLMDSWSSWSPTSEVQLPFLPTGDYKLHVKARNIFGQEIESQVFEYSIKPAYWNTWWFYLLEVSFFATLIIISIYLNKSGQQTFFTKSLTFMTLIIIVELLHSVMENTFKSAVNTPVYEFLLNVILALSIYPLERLMSNFLISKNLTKTKDIIKIMKGEAASHKDSE